jgi:phage terminase Nu1 subunit (DNA packaging protein)
MKLTTSQAAQGFQVTKKTIAEWVKKGMPKKKHGEFDFFTIVSWWAENIYRSDDSAGVIDAKEKYWAARARREVVRADEAENRVVPVDQVRDEAFQLARTVRDAILNVPDRISAELASYTDVHQVNQKLILELNEALEELSNMPLMPVLDGNNNNDD